MNNNNLSIVSLGVSLATLLLVAYIGFFGVSAELAKFEALKVGGAENYALVKQIYQSEQFKSSQKTQLEQALQQFGGTAPTGDQGTTSPTPTAPTNQQAGADGFTRGTLTPEQITSVTNNVVYEGNEGSPIVLIEYSDIECPFCQRHFSSKTVDTVIAKNNIKATFKHFPLSFHATAQKAGEAVECAAKEGKSVEFKNALFEATIADAGKKPTQEIILATAQELGLNQEGFSTCLNSDEMADKVKSHMNEGSTLFGVTGTPGNVLLNTETGQYVVVAGAYPADQFDALVAEISG